MPSREFERDYPNREWTWLRELPDVPPLDAFEEYGEPHLLGGFEDCNRYLRAGLYALWHVRELADARLFHEAAPLRQDVRG